MITALADAICRFAAADPVWTIFISGVLAVVVVGVVWAWCEEWRGASW